MARCGYHRLQLNVNEESCSSDFELTSSGELGCKMLCGRNDGAGKRDEDRGWTLRLTPVCQG